MKKITLFLMIALIVSIGLAGVATAESSYTIEKNAVLKQSEQYRIGQPIPFFDWSLERDTLIQLYGARNKQLATHSVWRSESGLIEGDCPSIGYPIPYDSQLTNPLQAAMTPWSDGGAPVIEQPEPNGLYGSKNSIATWVRCVYNVNGKTIISPVYIEDMVTAYPYPVTVNYTSKRVQPVMGALPTLIIEYNSTRN